MLKSYLKISFRNLFRNKFFSTLNIGGLAIGLTSCIFIIFYVYDELTFDRFHEKSEKIFRVTTSINTNRIRFTDQKIGPYLQRIYPEVENFVRFSGFDGKFRLGPENIYEPDVFKTEASVFDIFTYSLIQGHPDKVFEKEKSIVLSESLAAKYFEGVALGKTLLIDDEEYEVTGIMKDVPPNSDKWANGFVAGDFPDEASNDIDIQYDTYILLNENHDILNFRGKLMDASRHIWQEANVEDVFYEIQPLQDLHFTEGIQMDNAKGNKTNIYIFIITAVILLLVVIFNFINLTTVKSLDRAKEMGVRKAIGATSKLIVKQFLIESFLSMALAIVMCFILIKTLHPLFLEITGKSIMLHSLRHAGIIICGLIILLTILMAASVYPALILSQLNPIKSLKGKNRVQGGAIRNSFIFGQYFLSTALLIFLSIVVAQLNKMQDSDPGFKKDQVIVAGIPGDISVEELKYELLQNKGVVNVSTGEWFSLPGGGTTFTPVYYIKEGQEHVIKSLRLEADENYPDVLGLQLAQGKWVKEYPPAQWEGLIVINETLARQLGLTDPIGQQIETASFNKRKTVTIVGVVKDFHFMSLHNIIDPMAYFASDKASHHLFIRILPGHMEEIADTWRNATNGLPLIYNFLSDSIGKQYQSEETLSVLLIFFSSLTLILAALGLFGLTSYSITIRIKEIGIRKILGASVASIIKLFSKDYLKLVLAGSIAGSTVAVYCANQWLKGYAYKINLSWWFILLPFLFIISLSFIIVALRTYRTAQLNPIDSIKYE